jgi:hypothetical protein
MNDSILAAKELLKSNGYVVARIATSEWEKRVFELHDNYVAFRLVPKPRRVTLAICSM